MTPKRKKRAAELLREDAKFLMDDAILPLEEKVRGLRIEHAELLALADELDAETEESGET